MGGVLVGRHGRMLTRVSARLLSTGLLSVRLLSAGFSALLPAAGAAQTQLANAEGEWCAASGEQILSGNVVRTAVYQEQFSRYSPHTNRCFVEMRVLVVAADEHADRDGRFLYDGQTKELLAFAEIKNGKKSGRVFDLNHRTRSFANGGWDDASEYIYSVMAGDR